MFLQTPTKNVQELAKEEGEESETKLGAVIVTSEGAIPAVAGKRWDMWRATSCNGGTCGGQLPRSIDIVWWAKFASGQPPQVETNSDAPASFSSSPPAPSALA